MEPWRLSVSPGFLRFPTGNIRQSGGSRSISKTSPTSNPFLILCSFDHNFSL